MNTRIQILVLEFLGKNLIKSKIFWFTKENFIKQVFLYKLNNSKNIFYSLNGI